MFLWWSLLALCCIDNTEQYNTAQYNTTQYNTTLSDDKTMGGLNTLLQFYIQHSMWVNWTHCSSSRQMARYVAIFNLNWIYCSVATQMLTILQYLTWTEHTGLALGKQPVKICCSINVSWTEHTGLALCKQPDEICCSINVSWTEHTGLDQANTRLYFVVCSISCWMLRAVGLFLPFIQMD